MDQYTSNSVATEDVEYDYEMSAEWFDTAEPLTTCSACKGTGMEDEYANDADCLKCFGYGEY